MAIWIFPPSGTDGVPTMAAAGTSSHFSDPNGTTVAIILGDDALFLAGDFVCANVETTSNRELNIAQLRCIDFTSELEMGDSIFLTIRRLEHGVKKQDRG